MRRVPELQFLKESSANSLARGVTPVYTSVVPQGRECQPSLWESRELERCQTVEEMRAKRANRTTTSANAPMYIAECPQRDSVNE